MKTQIITVLMLCALSLTPNTLEINQQIDRLRNIYCQLETSSPLSKSDLGALSIEVFTIIGENQSIINRARTRNQLSKSLWQNAELSDALVKEIHNKMIEHMIILGIYNGHLHNNM